MPLPHVMLLSYIFFSWRNRNWMGEKIVELITVTQRLGFFRGMILAYAIIVMTMYGIGYATQRTAIFLSTMLSIRLKIMLKKQKDIDVQDPHFKLRGKQIVDSRCAVYQCESQSKFLGLKFLSHPKNIIRVYERLAYMKDSIVHRVGRFFNFQLLNTPEPIAPVDLTPLWKIPLKFVAAFFLRQHSFLPGFGQKFLVSNELMQVGLSNRALNVHDGNDVCQKRSSEMINNYVEVSMPFDKMISQDYNVVADSVYACHRIIDRECSKDRQTDFRSPKVMTSTSTGIGIMKSSFPFLSHPKTGILSSLSETSEGLYLFGALCVGALVYMWSDILFPTQTLAAQFLSSQGISSERLVKYPP
jgi:hypothetical protein